MNKSVKMLTLAALLASASTASMADDIKANTPISGYTQDQRGIIVRDPFGLCWRTGGFTPALAQAGCDDDLLPPPPPPPAPPPATPAPPPEAPKVVAPPSPPPVVIVDEKIHYQADAFFDFNKSVLKPEAKTKLDDLVSKLTGVKLEVIISVGHTDSVGSVAYNQKLSVKRAEAVKAYLISKGIEANRVYTEGKGKSQPVADNKTKEGRAKNRRVEIEVVGSKSVKK